MDTDNMAPEALLKQCTDRINHLVMRKLAESPSDLAQWVVMIGALPIAYPDGPDGGYPVIDPKPGRLESATRFVRARIAHNFARKTFNGKNECGEAVRLGEAYDRCLAELQAVCGFLRQAIGPQADLFKE